MTLKLVSCRARDLMRLGGISDQKILDSALTHDIPVGGGGSWLKCQDQPANAL